MKGGDYKMNDEFISKAMQIACYEHKEGTSSSYYWRQGSRILPNRLSISNGNEMTHVQRKGRNSLFPIVGQFIGSFKKSEQSPLKQHKPFAVRTQIFKEPAYPNFIGYGTLGISNESGKVESDNGDLIVMYSSDQWENIVIFYFAGMANVNDIEQVMKFLHRFVESGNIIVEQKKENASQQIPSDWIIK